MNIKVDMAGVIKGLKKYEAKVQAAEKQAMKETVVLIANDVIKIHPWKTRTGNNSRSIAYTVGKLTGSVFSTSGYGGFLETGTRYMGAYPYFKPALDRNFPSKFTAYMKAHLKW